MDVVEVMTNSTVAQGLASCWAVTPAGQPARTTRTTCTAIVLAGEPFQDPCSTCHFLDVHTVEGSKSRKYQVADHRHIPTAAASHQSNNSNNAKVTF
jgi:hypothetical protein